MRRRMRPALATACLLVATAGAADAAEEKKRELVPGKWYPSLESGVSLTQSSYSDNWSGGDRGSVVWTWILNATAENQVSRKVNTYNTLKLAYGQTHKQSLGEDGGRSWDGPEKSTDLIDLESLWRGTFGGFVDPFVAGRFESQFQDASDAGGRTIALNPLRFKESAGIARKFIDGKERSLLSRLGFSIRQNLRRQFDADPPANSTVSETTNDGGIEWTTDYKSKVLEDRVSWTSKLTFYKPVFYSGKSDLEALSADSLAAYRIDGDVASFTTAVDIDWENILTTQITKLISVNLYLKFVYDEYDNSVAPKPAAAAGALANPGVVRAAVRKAGQFKQTLSVGVTYRFL